MKYDSVMKVGRATKRNYTDQTSICPSLIPEPARRAGSRAELRSARRGPVFPLEFVSQLARRGGISCKFGSSRRVTMLASASSLPLRARRDSNVMGCPASDDDCQRHRRAAHTRRLRDAVPRTESVGLESRYARQTDSGGPTIAWSFRGKVLGTSLESASGSGTVTNQPHGPLWSFCCRNSWHNANTCIAPEID